MDADAKRGRTLIEESREAVIVLDERDVVLAASRRARQSMDGVREGQPVPAGLLSGDLGVIPLVVPYDVNGRRERLVYLSRVGDLAAYEELRAGFTAAVSHELRTPLARLLSLLETAALPGEDVGALVEQARGEVDQIRELIDDVLFLSELESGRAVVSLGSIRVLPVIERVIEATRSRAERAGVRLEVDCPASFELPLRQRMLQVVVENLVENAIRYAGEGATCRIACRVEDGAAVLEVSDDGAGLAEEDLSRLFERFYRGDRGRTTRGTGLGLAIVKHVVAAAGGTVEAAGGPGTGLALTARFPPR
jgi:two-component system phosphate regulon sensor histidine kinase PhoR